MAASLGIEVGEIVAGKYRIEAVLGAGGMGVVFAARHIALNGQFALKFLSSQALGNSQAVGRFYREAQAAVKLRSEHAVRVFDVGTHENGLPYLVMEYLEGTDLGQLLQTTGPLPIAEALDYVMQACAAIADAHSAGVIHRDIKPSNLFCVTRQEKSLLVKVLDFGISKVTDALAGDQGITVTGNFLGSPSYMSPEQMRAPDRVDYRSDIWSLGVVLYECLTAKLPFPANTLPEACLRVVQEPPIPPSHYRPDLPAGLEAVILRCLEKDRDARVPSANALAEALRSFQAPLVSAASSYLGEPDERARDIQRTGAADPAGASWGRLRHLHAHGAELGADRGDSRHATTASDPRAGRHLGRRQRGRAGRTLLASSRQAPRGFIGFACLADSERGLSA